MLATVRDLIVHKGYANAAVLRAIRENAAAAADPELRDLLHHILVSNRFWLLAVRGVPFDLEAESRVSSSLDELIDRFRAMQTQEEAWADAACDADLEQVLNHPLIPGSQCSVAQAWLQVCLHSQGHRAQCAKLIRRLGGVPPTTDFIIWLTTRPQADWGVARPGHAADGTQTFPPMRVTPEVMTRTWPEDWEARKQGVGCVLCADLTGRSFHSGRVSEALLERQAVATGHVVVVFRGRHAATLTDLTPDELAAYWLDVHDVGRAVELVFEPCHVNYELLGNVVPHVHVHVVPRYLDDPAPQRALPWTPSLVPEDAFARYERQLRDAIAAG